MSYKNPMQENKKILTEFLLERTQDLTGLFYTGFYWILLYSFLQEYYLRVPTGLFSKCSFKIDL